MKKFVVYIGIFLLVFGCSRNGAIVESVDQSTDFSMEVINNPIMSEKLETFYHQNNEASTRSGESGQKVDFDKVIFSTKAGENMDMVIAKNEDDSKFIIYYISQDEQDIISSLIMDVLVEYPGNIYEFECSEISGRPVCRGIMSMTDNTLQFTEVFIATRGPSLASWGCNMSLAVAGGVLTMCAGVATGGIGSFIVGVGWSAFQTMICSGL